MKKIDLNCDMGESYGNYSIGNDGAVFPYISSSNIACGFHGGDPLVIEETIKMALHHGVRIGAHPGYPDLNGFGRRKMQVPAAQLSAIIKYQVAAVKGMVESLGGKLSYVKPHGALYNSMVNDLEEAAVVVEAIKAIDPGLKIMGLAGSGVLEVIRNKGMQPIAEAFADRQYEANGKLMSRAKEGAVIHDAEFAVKQVMDIALHQQLTCADGSLRKLEAESFCIHGDNPAAVEILKALGRECEREGIGIGQN